MDQKKKTAFLLNLLVFPGIGHFYLHRKLAGALIVGTVLILLLAMLIVFEMDAYHQAERIINFQAYFQHAPQMAKNLWISRKSFYQMGLIFLSLVWLGSAVDVLRKQ